MSKKTSVLLPQLDLEVPQQLQNHLVAHRLVLGLQLIDSQLRHLHFLGDQLLQGGDFGAQTRAFFFKKGRKAESGIIPAKVNGNRRWTTSKTGERKLMKLT